MAFTPDAHSFYHGTQYLNQDVFDRVKRGGKGAAKMIAIGRSDEPLRPPQIP